MNQRISVSVKDLKNEIGDHFTREGQLVTKLAMITSEKIRLELLLRVYALQAHGSSALTAVLVAMGATQEMLTEAVSIGERAADRGVQRLMEPMKSAGMARAAGDVEEYPSRTGASGGTAGRPASGFNPNFPVSMGGSVIPKPATHDAVQTNAIDPTVAMQQDRNDAPEEDLPVDPQDVADDDGE
jgi:hypothetical protein